jgi:hypothetical protein
MRKVRGTVVVDLLTALTTMMIMSRTGNPERGNEKSKIRLFGIGIEKGSELFIDAYRSF